MFFEVADIGASVWVIVTWGILVGLVFSTVGAAGGILASVGLISILGIQDPNLVKPTAQVLTLVTPIIAVPHYYRQCRVVVSLALLFGAGGIFGALVGSSLSVSYLADLKTFKPVFGAFVLLISLQLAWYLLRTGSGGVTASDRAAAAFEGLVHSGGETCSIGVRHRHWSIRRIVFEFGGEQFSFSPWLPLVAGAGIAVVASAFGVGGGFLLVPFMTAIMGLPMFIVAATAALAVAVSSTASVANYIRLGVELDLPLLGFMLAGTVAGAWLGPVLSRHLHETWLKGVLIVVLLVIGLRYLSVV
ncbi:MAG TPA: sulfite exporter TauE/SafE family protein [Gammaproteobacteria bacterium]|nr:sulfite exporter TauE/SafE family protein [Gammaproteobacteria bacterium]